MDEHQALLERYRAVMDRVAAAAVRSGRRPEDIITIAVTKFAAADEIRALIDAGHQDFGENKAQQLEKRVAMAAEYAERLRVLTHTRAAPPDPERVPTERGEADHLRWHMIGHLQRNKAKKVAGIIRLVHSVDSLRLVEELQAFGLKKDKPIDVLVQVNVSGEESKYGVPLPAAQALCEQIDSLVYVRVRGLMTMAPFVDNPEEVRWVFARARELFEEIRRTGISEGRFNLLSMGMTRDFDVAIEEGANLVRVGTAIFGERDGPVDEEDDAPGADEAEPVAAEGDA
ncbi:MAG: YggS family pyridoxal phosphate-dependent enzyme [Planctomycetota bacterium]